MLILIIDNIYSSCMLFDHFICIISIPQRLYEASRLDCLSSTCPHHHTLLTYPSALQGSGDGATFSRMPSLYLVPGSSLLKKGETRRICGDNVNKRRVQSFWGQPLSTTHLSATNSGSHWHLPEIH